MILVSTTLVLLFASYPDCSEEPLLGISRLGRLHFLEPTAATRAATIPIALLILDSAFNAQRGPEPDYACVREPVRVAAALTDSEAVYRHVTNRFSPLQLAELRGSASEPPPAVEEIRAAQARCLDRNQLTPCSANEFALLLRHLGAIRDPRDWSAEVTAAFVLSARRAESETGDGWIGYRALTLLGRMGFRRGSDLLKARWTRIGKEGWPECKKCPEMGHLPEPWTHFRNELSVYLEDWREREGGKAWTPDHSRKFQAYLLSRWTELDDRAPSPDVEAIERLLREASDNR